MDKWQTKSSKYLFKEPWFTVREDHVVLPNGAEIPNYYVLEYPDWVNTIAVTKNGEMIMIKQYRHGLKKISYELCAGVMDKTDKNALFTAQRELLEETGYGKGTWKEWMVVSANPGTHTNITHCFLATDLEKIADINHEATEDLLVEILPVKEVFTLLAENKIIQALHAAPLWKYFSINHFPV